MDSGDQNRVSRRRFLHSLGLIGALGAGGSLLTACGGSDDSGGDSTPGNGAGTTASADCSDLSGLSDSEKKRRKQMVKSLNYVEETPKADKNCANCQLYQPEQYGPGCGGCQLFPGPVTENGYCTSWSKRS